MRLFVAVWPSESVLDDLAALPRPERAGVRWTTRHQWHVTLRFLGDVAEPDPIVEAMRSLVLPPASAVLGPNLELLNPRIVSVPVAGLDALAAAVVDATKAIGKPPERRPFHGHVTLARLKAVPAAAARDITGAGINGSWPVDEIHLVQSRLSPKGARYESVAVHRTAGRLES